MVSDGARLRDEFLLDPNVTFYDEHRIDIPVAECPDGRFIRSSFQGYNDDADFGQRRDALAALL
jgi:hypothetical protein